MSISLVLLNDTLRWHDNPLLQVGSGTKVAVVVLNKAAFFGQQYGIRRANLQRLQQQLTLITELTVTLARRNIGLVSLFGDTALSLHRLAQQLNASRLYCAEPVAAEERSAIGQLAKRYDVIQLDCNSLLAGPLRPDLSSLPDSFTPFRKQREPLLRVAQPLAHAATDTDWFTTDQVAVYNQPFTALLQRYQPSYASQATEQAALARVQHFIWQGRHLLHYKHSRNQLLGTDYASFCSVPLSLGSLSVRQLWHEIVRFEQQVTANESTYWLKFELLWREFFRWQFRQHGTRWFSKGAIKGPLDFSPPQLSSKQRALFNRWCQADTGVAFIDANMLLLNQSGLMSNRGRQNVASYLMHDLAIDWRLGAAYFEQRLLDYDCASNWGNWAYIAGSGNSSERQFNVHKQALQYDTDGSFVRAMLCGSQT